MPKSVVGLFNSQNEAQAALSELQNAGFSQQNVTMVSQPNPRLSQMLTSVGIPQQDAQLYAQGVQNGNPLIVLQALPDNQAENAADILDRHNIIDISSMMGTSSQSMTSNTSMQTGTRNFGTYQGGEAVIPIIEEEIQVGKRQVESGGVRVNTRVEEIPVNEQVTLRDEHVDIHRKPVDRPASSADFDALQGGTIEVRETDEEAIVSKQARVVEEVHVKKEVGQRVETIQDTVRRTDVDVNQLGGQERSVGYSGTMGTTGTTDVNVNMTDNEGTIERGASGLGNSIERGTGLDIDRDGDVGQRDPRNNI